MTAEEFAGVCNSAIGEESVRINGSSSGIMFQTFIKEAVAHGINWLNENAFSLSELPSVILSFS